MKYIILSSLFFLGACVSVAKPKCDSCKIKKEVAKCSSCKTKKK